MDTKNREEYINTLENNESKIHKKEELLTFFLTDETLKKFKKIKKLMEWNKDFTLNSVFTFFFNIENSKETKKIKSDSNKKQVEIKFTPTFKNEERIKEYLKVNTTSSIIELSIDLFYKQLIGSNSK